MILDLLNHDINYLKEEFSFEEISNMARVPKSRCSYNMCYCNSTCLSHSHACAIDGANDNKYNVKKKMSSS